MLYITTTRNATNRMCTQCTNYQASGQAGICSHGLHSKLRDLANSEQLSATGPVMAGRVLSAAVGSLLVLVALLTAVLKCQCSCSGQCMPITQLLHSCRIGCRGNRKERRPKKSCIYIIVHIMDQLELYGTSLNMHERCMGKWQGEGQAEVLYTS